MIVESLSYFIRPQQYSTPLDWDRIFQRQAKLAVEIGFGNGEFLISLAKLKREYNFVGFETSITSLVKVQRKIYDHSLKNIRVALVDGKFALREFFKDGSVERVYTNFPCPWPKKSHQEKRFTNRDFAQTLGAVLTFTGIYQLVTDVEWYARQMKDILLETGCFDLLQFDESNKAIVGTRYERRWLSEGRKTYILIVQKKSQASIERWTWEEDSMPNIHLNSINEQKVPQLSGTVFRHHRGVFVVRNVYFREGEYLLRVVSNEENFQQRYFISIEREKDGWLVKLDPDASAYRTPVVKFSVRKIAEVISS